MAGRLRIYIETSVFGFALDTSDRNREKQEATVGLFSQVSAGRLEGYTSALVLAELGGHQTSEYRARFLKMVTANRLIQLPSRPDPAPLASLLINEGVIPATQPADAAHLAIAILHPGIDVLVSWNYRHLVNVSVKRTLVPVLLKAGHRIGLEIATPQEVLLPDA